jgi:hypothetical protein
MTTATGNERPAERPTGTLSAPADTADPHDEPALPVACHEPLPPTEASESD